MINRIKNILGRDDGLIGAGLIFMIGTFFSSGFNYLYHLLMGRMLGPEEYGALGSLFAIIYFVGFASATFNNVLSKFSAEYKGKNQAGHLHKFIRQAFFRISLIGGIGLFGYVLLSPYIAWFLKLDSTSGVILVGAIAYFSLLSSILIGALNGLQRFGWQNIAGCVSTIFKLGLGVLFVYLGFGVFGALGGILVGVLFSIGIGFMVLRKLFIRDENVRLDAKKIIRFAVPVFLSAVLPTIMITVDQMLVKHFFTSAEAGEYAAAANIARIIWFGSSVFVAVAFPKIVDMKAKKKDASGIITRTILYTMFLALAGCSAYFVMPNFIVSVFYGHAYLGIVPYIGIFGLAMGFYSIVLLLITYDLAIERYGFLWILFLGVLAQLIGILLFHSTLFTIIKIFFGVNIFLLISLVMYNYREFGLGND